MNCITRMKVDPLKWRAGIVSLSLWLSAPRSHAATANAVDFSRDILPILSENCFQCHGPDEKERQAKLRLDTQQGALGKGKSGEVVIAPGKSRESELIRRVTSKDRDEVMPPPKSKHKLTAKQIGLLKRWVDAGAVWGKHWAYEVPQRPAVPKV